MGGFLHQLPVRSHGLILYQLVFIQCFSYLIEDSESFYSYFTTCASFSIFYLLSRDVVLCSVIW